MIMNNRAGMFGNLLAVCVATIVIISMMTINPASGDPPRRLAHLDQMPKPVLFPDGTMAIYIVEHSGPGLPQTPAIQHVTVRYSTDDGESWSEPKQLFTLPADAGYFGYFVPLVDREGDAHLFLLGDANTGAVRPRADTGPGPRVEPLSRQRLDVWHARTTGDRARWTKPRIIWEGRAGDLQSVIQMSNGRIVLPVSYYVDRNWGHRGTGFKAFTYTGQFDTTVLYSDDGGANWMRSDSVLRTATASLADYGAVEPVVIELRDGRVWMLLRTQLGRFYESFSRDGASWSPARPSGIRSSDSPASLIRMQDGRIVMLWNNCLRYPYAQGARNVLHAAVLDQRDGVWRGYREVLRDPYRNQPPPPSGDYGVSYPFAAPTSDGKGVVYSLWVQTGRGRSLERFDLDWLTAMARADDFSGGLDGWSTFGTRGVQVVDYPGSVDGHVMRLAKSDPDWPAAAVWNFPGRVAGSLRMRVLLEPGARDFTLQLTDHFSVPFDDRDRYHSLYRWPITTDEVSAGGTGTPTGRWIDLELKWDCQTGRARVTIDGRLAATLDQRRSAGSVSYLRVLSDADHKQAAALIIDRVQVEIEPDDPDQ
jgi:BNR repeat-like domain